MSIVLKSGKPNLVKISGILRACKGISLASFLIVGFKTTWKLYAPPAAVFEIFAVYLGKKQQLLQ